MAIDKVKPLKLESSAAGGTENDLFPTETDPTEDHLSAKGMAFEGNEVAVIDADSGVMRFKDSETELTTLKQLTTPSPQTQAIILFDDFDGRMAWNPATSGSGAASSVSAGNASYASGKHVGVARIATGTILNTSAALNWSGALTNSIVLGNGQAEFQTLVRLPILSTVGNNYTVRPGLGTSTTTDHADGVYFEYNASSANWVLKTASNSSRTSTTSSIAVAANTWTHLRWVCNSAGTSVEFFVDGVSAGTITTNIPTTTGRGCGGIFQITNTTVVAAAREMLIDYFYFAKQFTARD